MKFISLFLIIVLSLPAWSKAEEQGWRTLSLDYALGEKTGLSVAHEERARSATFDDPYLKAVQAVLNRTLPNLFWWGGGYRRETVTGRSGSKTNENRVIFDLGWKPSVAQKLTAVFRARTELRNFIEPQAKDHTRFRFQAGLKKTTSIRGKKVAPYLIFEIFGDTKEDKVNRNRVYSGADFGLSDHLTFSLGYVRQDTDRFEKVHAFQVGLKARY